MILFIIIALYILFESTKETVLEILSGDRKIVTILKSVNEWFWTNIGMNLINWVTVILLSCLLFFGLCFVCPSETSQWEFDINALRDNLVTEGEFRGSMFGIRGSVDGEISYFYSRSLSLGEKIEHIPANKTYVRYSDTDHPHVEVHQSRIDIPDWMYDVFFLKWMNNKQTNYYVLVVPEGTIVNEGTYEIDMK